MTSNRFYLACLRDNVGSNVSFHAKAGRGYTSDLDKAEIYTQAGAQAAWNRGRSFDQPLCANQVDKLAIWKVDCQYIPCESEMPEGVHRFVGFMKGRWDGNDVYWLQEDGRPTINFQQASVFSKPIDNDNEVWMPFITAEKAKRRTFNSYMINRNTLVQGAGLVTPGHIKRYRRRKESDKTRFNCHGCGQIVWQENPHDFNGCKNKSCEEFRI